MSLLRKVLNAYGGEALWRKVESIEAVVSTGGSAFLLKTHIPLRKARYIAQIQTPVSRFGPINRRGDWGSIKGSNLVRVEAAGGQVLRERKNPRDYFPYGRRLFHWDDLDFSYFVGYAGWNYFAFPALLIRSEIEWREISDTVLEARFPEHLPTHSPVQRFIIDPKTHLVYCHQYIAEVFGSWAGGAHFLLEHRRWQNDVPVPSYRRVYWQMRNGRWLPFPTIIWIRVHDWRMKLK